MKDNCRVQMRSAEIGTGALKLSVVGGLLLAACSSGHKSARLDPAMLASIPAELRMVGPETTWVARGIGYELITRQKPDVLPLIAAFDDQSRFFVKVFGAEPSKVIATVRRVGPPGAALESAAPVPLDEQPVIEVVYHRPLEKGEKASADSSQRTAQSSRGGRGGSRGSYGGRGGATTGDGRGAVDPLGDEGASTSRIVRAWLSARATKLTGKPGIAGSETATFEDTRVPAWAQEALPTLAIETAREDTITARLATQIDSLYPIHAFLTMARPSALVANGRGGRAGADPGAGRGGGGGVIPGGVGTGGTGGYGGGMGGRGGRGGMGGMGGMGGGMGGRGGSSGRGGGGARTDGGHPPGPYTGNALFAAEAQVFGRYLVVREGPQFVGALVDAQIQGRNIVDIFAAAQMVPSNIERLDIEFHRWLIDRATHPR